MPQVIPLTSCIITCGQKQKRQNEIICTFLMDAMLSEHHVTRFDVWSQTGLMKNGRTGMVTAQAKATRLQEHYITDYPSNLVHTMWS